MRFTPPNSAQNLLEPSERAPLRDIFYTQDGEERYRAYGITAAGRALTVAYTERNGRFVRSRVGT